MDKATFFKRLEDAINKAPNPYKAISLGNNVAQLAEISKGNLDLFDSFARLMLGEAFGVERQVDRTEENLEYIARHLNVTEDKEGGTWLGFG